MAMAQDLTITVRRLAFGLALMALSLVGAGASRAWAGDDSFGPAIAAATPDSPSSYRIGPLDTLDVTVFGVKDLSLQKLQVDAGGQILFPLIGSVTAQGKTTSELAAEIASRLGQTYMQSPQVSVVVDEAVSQKVSVEGAVTEPGVFQMKGRTSLLEAVALAKGPSKDANLRRVAIIRSQNGVVRAATFDYASISAGKARDPEVLGNDVVVVDESKSKQFWHQTVALLPALYVFSFLHF